MSYFATEEELEAAIVNLKQMSNDDLIESLVINFHRYRDCLETMNTGFSHIELEDYEMARSELKARLSRQSVEEGK